MHMCGLITKTTYRVLARCFEWLFMGFYNNFFFPCETARRKKKDLFTFCLCSANCRIRADLILLKMKTRYSPWKVRISLMVVSAPSVISFGGRFYFQSPPSDTVENFPVSSCQVYCDVCCFICL